MENHPQAVKADVVIVGAGIAGLSLACGLAKQTSLDIAVIEAKQMPVQSISQDSAYQPRVSAISLASQRILKALGVWDELISARAGRFDKIHVWDAAQQANIDFDARDIAAPRLGYILENELIQQKLLEKAKSHHQIQLFFGEKIESLSLEDARAGCRTESGIEFLAQLVVAADGAQSKLRQLSGIAVDLKDYHQTAIVSHVVTEKPHEACAQQVFLETGPLAFLPLPQDCHSSIVWSMPAELAKQKMQLDDAAFRQELRTAFADRMGEVTSMSQRYCFPLRKLVAENYIANRFALLGDAAHVVHPLAGQGVNIGLLDSVALLDVMVDAISQNRQFASLATLRRYERWRKTDNQMLLFGIDWIKEFFAKEEASVRRLRGIGLNMTDNVSVLKKQIIRHAVGERHELPSLAAC